MDFSRCLFMNFEASSLVERMDICFKDSQKLWVCKGIFGWLSL